MGGSSCLEASGIHFAQRRIDANQALTKSFWLYEEGDNKKWITGFNLESQCERSFLKLFVHKCNSFCSVKEKIKCWTEIGSLSQ